MTFDLPMPAKAVRQVASCLLPIWRRGSNRRGTTHSTTTTDLLIKLFTANFWQGAWAC